MASFPEPDDTTVIPGEEVVTRLTQAYTYDVMADGMGMVLANHLAFAQFPLDYTRGDVPDLESLGDARYVAVESADVGGHYAAIGTYVDPHSGYFCLILYATGTHVEGDAINVTATVRLLVIPWGRGDLLYIRFIPPGADRPSATMEPKKRKLLPTIVPCPRGLTAPVG